MARGLLLIATMKTHSIGSISKMGAVIALFGLSTACGGATTYDAGGSAGQGGAAGQGGSGGGGPTTSDAGMECPPPGDANPGAMLGLSSDSPMNVEGAVSRAFADRLEVMTSTGTLTLSWVGPPLDAAFAANEGIQVVRTRVDPSAPGGWSVVRSARATAAVFNGTMWNQLGTTKGSTHSLDVPFDYPSLRYSLVSCCSVAAALARNCSYGSLEATYDGMATQIDLGMTGRVGPWSITNVVSNYHIDGSGESAWGGQVSLLGPATARAADGGI
jgi:hypothetical protein